MQKNKLFYSLSKHFLDTQYKNDLDFFAFIKKIFLQTLVEIFFRYNEFLIFGTPWKKIHTCIVGYQTRVKIAPLIHNKDTNKWYFIRAIIFCYNNKTRPFYFFAPEQSLFFRHYYYYS